VISLRLSWVYEKFYNLIAGLVGHAIVTFMAGILIELTGHLGHRDDDSDSIGKRERLPGEPFSKCITAFKNPGRRSYQ
jgi:hypothetical protein|tara:strand:- start:14 stop:247 length:234 start_codon:yes stop_codon:yes gene_type:complete